VKNKNKNNSIIFLTTLSVYLGLVLVGATPQVLAQTSKSLPISKEASIATGTQIIFINAKWTLELEKIISGSSASAHLIGNIILSDKEVSEWQIQLSEGNTQAINFLREEFFSAPKVSHPAVAAFLYQKIFVEIETNQNEIKFEYRISFRDSGDALEFGKSYEYILNNREKLKNKIGKAEILFLENTKSSFDNNQVSVVTRLPRGSLDEILKQDAKANGK
jgi:hypothetical protein